MNTFKIACLVPLFAIGASHAITVPCNGFKITVHNELTEQLVVSHAHLTGAILVTDSSLSIDANKKQIYTVGESVEGGVMSGVLTFNTSTIPNKSMNIKFNLTNRDAICELEELPSTGNLSLSKTRLPGGVNYTINY